MRALLHLASLALVAAVISGGAPAHVAIASASDRVPSIECPAGTNWNHVLMICQ
jgi:hypothetical protein